jgi:hypothetical protein
MKTERGYEMNSSRTLLFCALLLIVLTSSCNFPVATPPPLGTIYPTGSVATSAISTSTLDLSASTAAIPVTGVENIVSLQCEFCVNEEAHAVFVLPEAASFLVPDPLAGVTCLTVQVINGRRIVVCRGPQMTVFTLNVCVDNTNCKQLPLTLDPCPSGPQAALLTPGTTFTPTTVLVSPQTAAPSVLPSKTPTVVSTSTAIPPSAVPTQMPTKAPPTQTIAAPALATPTLSHALQPTRPSNATQQPGTGLQDPAEFVRWYFATIWTARNYQQLWDTYLTPKFQTTVSPGGFSDYVQWWESVDHATVNSVTVLQNDGARAFVRVNLSFYLKDGRVLENREYDYSLVYDLARRTWMFD